MQIFQFWPLKITKGWVKNLVAKYIFAYILTNTCKYFFPRNISNMFIDAG